MRGERIVVAKCIVACRMQVKGGREALVFLLHRDNQPLGAAHGGQGQAGIKVTCPSVRSVSHHSFGGDSKGAKAVIQLGELLIILDLHRQGLSIIAIARRTGRDPKTIRKYIERGLGPRAYGPRRVGRPTKIAPYLDYLRERVTVYPDLSAVRLTREIKERGYSGVYTAVKHTIAAIRPERQGAATRFAHRGPPDTPEQRSPQRRLVRVDRRQWPDQSRFARPKQISGNRGLADLQPLRDRSDRQPLYIGQPQDRSQVLHRGSTRLLPSRHRPSQTQLEREHCPNGALENQPPQLSAIQRKPCPTIAEITVRELPKSLSRNY